MQVKIILYLANLKKNPKFLWVYRQAMQWVIFMLVISIFVSIALLHRDCSEIVNLRVIIYSHFYNNNRGEGFSVE